jgi:hypothetical protein
VKTPKNDPALQRDNWLKNKAIIDIIYDCGFRVERLVKSKSGIQEYSCITFITGSFMKTGNLQENFDYLGKYFLIINNAAWINQI